MHGIPLIAVVEDDASLRSALETLLASLGYRAVTYDSAISFLASTDCRSCDCVISDINMPRMSGFELQEQLRGIGHEVPVILITARTDLGLEAQAKASGAHCLLIKPFDVNQLIESLAGALGD